MKRLEIATNIRNEIAHGIIGEASASSGIYLFFMVAVIKLLTYTSVKCYKILTESEKLKELIIPDEDAIKIEEDESP